MTFVDVVVIGVIVLAGLISWLSGFVRLVSGIGGWIGAAVATIYGFPHLRPIARGWISDSLVADGVAAIAIFIVTLLVLSFISHQVSRQIQASGFRSVDRSLGLLAGLIIGVFIISAAYLLIDQATEGADRPKWLNEARTEPIVRRTAYFLWSFAPRDWQTAAPGFEREQNAGQGNATETESAIKNLISPAPKGDAPSEKEGYTNKEREEMDRLIRGTN